MVVGADLLGRLFSTVRLLIRPKRPIAELADVSFWCEGWWLLIVSWPVVQVLRCVEDELGLCSLRSIDLRDLEWAHVELLFSRMGVDHWADVLVMFTGQHGLDDARHDVVHGVDDDFGLPNYGMVDQVVDLLPKCLVSLLQRHREVDPAASQFGIADVLDSSIAGPRVLLQDLFRQVGHDLVELMLVFCREVVQRWWTGLSLGEEVVVVLLASLDVDAF